MMRAAARSTRPADVGRVQVVVLHGVGDTVRDASSAHQPSSAGRTAASCSDCSRTARPSDSGCRPARPASARASAGSGRRRHLGHPGREHGVPVDATARSAPRRSARRCPPRPPTAARAARAPAARAGVPAHRPAAVGVHGEHLGDQARDPLVDQPDQATPRARSPAPLTLNQTRPAVVSNRIALDQGRACGCSHSPVSRMPSSASRSATQSRASSRKAVLVQSSTDMLSRRSVRPAEPPARVREVGADGGGVGVERLVVRPGLPAQGEHDLAAVPVRDHPHRVGDDGAVGEGDVVVGHAERVAAARSAPRRRGSIPAAHSGSRAGSVT